MQFLTDQAFSLHKNLIQNKVIANIHLAKTWTNTSGKESHYSTSSYFGQHPLDGRQSEDIVEQHALDQLKTSEYRTSISRHRRRKGISNLQTAISEVI